MEIVLSIDLPYPYITCADFAFNQQGQGVQAGQFFWSVSWKVNEVGDGER